MAIPSFSPSRSNPTGLSGTLSSLTGLPSSCSPEELAKARVDGLCTLAERNSNFSCKDIVEAFRRDTLDNPQFLPLALDELHDNYTKMGITIEEVINVELAALSFMKVEPQDRVECCYGRFTKTAQWFTESADKKKLLGRFAKALAPVDNGAMLALLAKYQKATTPSKPSEGKRERKDDSKAFDPALTKEIAKLSKQNEVSIEQQLLQLKKDYEEGASHPVLKITQILIEIAGQLEDPSCQSVDLIKEKIPLLVHAGDEHRDYSIVYMLMPSIQRCCEALQVKEEELLSLDICVISSLASKDALETILLYAARRVKDLKDVFSTPARKKRFMDDITRCLPKSSSATSEFFAVDIQDLERESSSRTASGSTSSPAKNIRPLLGDIDGRYAKIEKACAGSSSLDSTRNLAHELFSRSRAFPPSTDHYLLSALLHAKQPSYPLLHTVMKRMVDAQIIYFNNCSPPSPKKSAFPSKKQGERVAYYIGGEKNWKRFIDSGQSWVESPDQPAGLRVLNKHPDDTALEQGALDAIRHCDTFAKIYFKAPVASFSERGECLQGRQEIQVLMEQSAADNSQLRTTLKKILQGYLTEERLIKAYSGQAASIMEFLQNEWNPPKLLPPPKPVPPLITPPSSPPRISSSPPKTSIGIPHKGEKTPPSYRKHLLLCSGVAALFLLLWKGESLWQRAKGIFHRITSFSKPDLGRGQ